MDTNRHCGVVLVVDMQKFAELAFRVAIRILWRYDIAVFIVHCYDSLEWSWDLLRERFTRLRVKRLNFQSLEPADRFYIFLSKVWMHKLSLLLSSDLKETILDICERVLIQIYLIIEDLEVSWVVACSFDRLAASQSISSLINTLWSVKFDDHIRFTMHSVALDLILNSLQATNSLTVEIHWPKEDINIVTYLVASLRS